MTAWAGGTIGISSFYINTYICVKHYVISMQRYMYILYIGYIFVIFYTKGGVL